ncbi:Cof subfamily protein (haloacid dehalogenase superfamily) [Enterococcus rotai]|uniref:Hydrolase n=1 Tax=Enterococcus rotai TaxID=118060 RepID=A0A0U2IUW1_9ENTE|nr:HAD family hydrolase [Enterococcus rotai]ALS38574.1 hydrolase [Enterococcus rotai]
MNVVFCDIDGTFQDLGGEVPQVNYDAIYALQKQGDHFVFISGRGYAQLTELMDQLDSECDVIFSNGGGYKLVGEPVQYNHCLSMAECERTMAILEERNIFYHIHTNEGIILKAVEKYETNILDLRKKLEPMGAMGKQIMDFKESFFKEQCQHVDDPYRYLTEHPELKVMKIELMEASDQEHELLRDVLSSDSAEVFSSFIQCLEIVDPKSSKGNAINEFMKKYPGARSYGIGDGENDLAMLDVVDVPVAVGNAKPIVKEKCQKIIGDCLDGGVGQFIFEEIIE